MEPGEAIKQIESCTECDVCLSVCHTYEVTQNKAFSPIGRLEAAKKVFQADDITPEMVDGVFSCMSCQRCNLECPQEIDISGIVHEARGELLRKGVGPLETIDRVIQQMEDLGNMVNGDPAKRWEWLPEEFPERESDTLLYVGCLPCYLVPQVAISSYLLLKRLGVHFMMLKDEGCCGNYLYHMGRGDIAGEKFEENRKRFKRLGIKKVIATCPACQLCLSPDRKAQANDFEVLHLVQVLPDLLRERHECQNTKLAGTLRASYQDPCELGRAGMGIYEEPREILNLCGVELVEMDEDRERAACCGGLLAVAFRDICTEVGARFLEGVKADNIITACPSCLLRLNYASRKRGKGKTAMYVSEVVLDFLDRTQAS